MKKIKIIPILISLVMFLVSAVQVGCNRDEGSQLKTNESITSLKPSGDNETGQKSGSYDKKYLGSYRIRLTGFTGKLIVFSDDGILKGSIQFTSWGKGKKQPLKKVSIKGRKIYFIRSVSTKKELEEFGGSRYFEQVFFGEFSDDGKTIKGYFKDSGGQNSWDGRK